MNVENDRAANTTESPQDSSFLKETNGVVLSHYFQRFPDPVVVTDSKGREVFLNEAAEKLRGCSLEEEDRLRICKDVLACTMGGKRDCFILHCLSHGENLNRFPVRIRNCRGEWFSLTITVSLLKDREGSISGCIAILRDVKADLLSVPEIGSKIATLESLLENFPTPFFTVDQDLVISHMNEAMEKLSGFPRNDVIGQMTCASVLSTPQCNTRDCLLKQSMKNKTPMAGLRRVVKNREGKEIPVVVNASIITDQSGLVIGGFEAYQDISSIVEAQEKIEETRIQLIHAEKMASVGRLAAGVAHEINNPLTSILCFSELLARETGINPRWRGDLEQVIMHAIRCKDIVRNLLIFSRQPGDRKDSMDVNETMVRCIESFTPQALVHDMEIVQDFQTDLPRIRGNRDHLEQVFTNIIINSRDAMRGMGRLTISTQFDSRKQIVVIKFTDTGCGISSDHIDEIFDPFFTTKPPGEGTGLGLSIVHEIIRQHGGSIAVESHSSGGTTFTILIPLECPEDPSEDLENREGIPK